MRGNKRSTFVRSSRHLQALSRLLGSIFFLFIVICYLFYISVPFIRIAIGSNRTLIRFYPSDKFPLKNFGSSLVLGTEPRNELAVG